MKTMRPLSAMLCQQASAVLPPLAFVPRQLVTPSSAIQHSPWLMAASPLRIPSVI